MTFEARDSAAKVVPARFRFSQTSSLKIIKSQRNRKTTSSQTNKWDHQLGLFRSNRSPSSSINDASRRQVKSEFLQFSKNLQDKHIVSHMKKSFSVPSLVEYKSPKRKITRCRDCILLNPELLKRHAISMDNPGYNPYSINRNNLELQRLNESQISMSMDLHIPNEGSITLKVKDRSDTAMRHQLARQIKIEDSSDCEELNKDAIFNCLTLPGNYCIRYPDDFVPRKKISVNPKIFEDPVLKDLLINALSPDFGKISSPNFRKMSLDKIGSERKLEKTSSCRKASFELKRSPDLRKTDYRIHSTDCFTAEYIKYLTEDHKNRTRCNSGDNMQRRIRYPKSDQSCSLDNRRQSFDQYRGDSQSSHYSLNTQVVIEDRRIIRDHDLNYTAATTATSLNQNNWHDNSDYDSHNCTYDSAILNSTVLFDGEVAINTLLEKPELENLPKIKIKNLTHSLYKSDKDLAYCTNEKTQYLNQIIYEAFDYEITNTEIKRKENKCEDTFKE